MSADQRMSNVAIVGPTSGILPPNTVSWAKEKFSARMLTPAEALERYRANRDSLGIILVHSLTEEQAREFLLQARDGRMQTLRIILWTDDAAVERLAAEDAFDIQAVVPLAVDLSELEQTITFALEA